MFLTLPAVDRVYFLPSIGYSAYPILHHSHCADLRTKLQQAHRPHDGCAGSICAVSIVSVRAPGRVRRRLALQRWRTVIRDSCGQGKGKRRGGFATGEGDVLMA